jgi:GTP-binding protein HflX
MTTPLTDPAAPPVRTDPKQVQPGFDAQRGMRFGAKTLVVMPERDGSPARERGPGSALATRDGAARLEEAVGLAAAINLNVVERDIVRIRKASAATLFGKGQIERIHAAVSAQDIEVVVVDGALSPIQQRNLEKAFDAKVIDRTGLILEIFGERATTREGSLQVELAHLDYQASRLVRSWTHLERQRGGVGFLGGPGETQIEADRRQIRDKMAKLRRELDEVKRTRALHRDRRAKAPYPVVALVGYTNAGKSTLFNRLTGATVMAEDLLFATLDPTMRAIDLPGVDKVILSDTVGFISALPTQLVAAFRATLEEVIEADLIVHVRDIAHPDSEAQAADVAEVLRGLGVIDGGDVPGGRTVPMITALNKIDLLDAEARAGLEAHLSDDAVAISAVSGDGVDTLQALIATMLQRSSRVADFVLAPGDGKRAAWLYAHGEVIDRADADDGSVTLKARLTPEMAARFAVM